MQRTWIDRLVYGMLGVLALGVCGLAAFVLL